MPAAACDSEPYLASICTFSMSWCPRGYLPADGRTLPVSQYSAVYSLIGFAYGGDNVNNFALPDLRGRSAVGTGLGGGLATAASLAQKIGQQQLVLSAAQTPLAAHTHGAAFAPTTGPATLNLPATAGNLNVTALLPVSPGGGASGTTVGLAAGQNGYLTGMKGSTGVDDVTFTGPYTSSAPASPAYLPASVKVTGSPSTAATSVQVSMVNGGTVTLAQAAQAATVPTSTQSPAIGMSVCVAVEGLYPNRP